MLNVETSINAADPAMAIQAQQLNMKGESVSADLCPDKIWALKTDLDYERMPAANMPDLFYARGHWIVSQCAADVLGRFDLGGGALHPVRQGIFLDDKRTRLPGDYFTWIFGNMKAAFLPDQTPNKEPFGIAGLRWNLPWKMKDSDIAVSEAALAGPDVWLDPILFDAVFLSGPLGNALEAAGLKSAFFLSKARVI